MRLSSIAGPMVKRAATPMSRKVSGFGSKSCPMARNAPKASLKKYAAPNRMPLFRLLIILEIGFIGTTCWLCAI